MRRQPRVKEILLAECSSCKTWTAQFLMQRAFNLCPKCAKQDMIDNPEKYKKLEEEILNQSQ